VVLPEPFDDAAHAQVWIASRRAVLLAILVVAARNGFHGYT